MRSWIGRDDSHAAAESAPRAAAAARPRHSQRRRASPQQRQQAPHLWPVKLCVQKPACRSHTLTCRSAPAVATYLQPPQPPQPTTNRLAQSGDNTLTLRTGMPIRPRGAAAGCSRTPRPLVLGAPAPAPAAAGPAGSSEDGVPRSPSRAVDGQVRHGRLVRAPRAQQLARGEVVHAARQAARRHHHGARVGAHGKRRHGLCVLREQGKTGARLAW